MIECQLISVNMEDRLMNEKIYKTISGSGAASLVMGILVLAMGIAAGVVMIVHGAKLLSCRRNILL